MKNSIALKVDVKRQAKVVRRQIKALEEKLYHLLNNTTEFMGEETPWDGVYVACVEFLDASPEQYNF